MIFKHAQNALACRFPDLGRKPLIACLAIGISVMPGFSGTNVLTFRNDNQRTGQNVTEKVLTPANVAAASFGKLFSVAVDGKVDAQPLYLSSVAVNGNANRSVVYVATEHDSVYAFDANTGVIYWKTSLLRAGETPSDNRGCDQVSPEIGITATPVIDLSAGAHGTIYLIAMSKDASGNYYQRLHALDVTTGAEQFSGPKAIAASYPGTGDNSSNGNVIFDAKQYKSRPGLLLLNGIVYTAWGSHCDARPYTGWLLGYNKLTLAQTSVFNFAPNGREAALWGSGGGVAADTSGNIFVSVANGSFDTTLTAGGFPSKGDYGNAFVKLSVSNNKLSAADYWTMDNTVSESGGDVDLGSGSLMLLPDLRDASGKVRHLGTGAGKDANVYVFDRDNMGKFDSANNSTLYQEIPGGLTGGEFASPAWFNNTVYYGAVGDSIRAFQVSLARLSSTPVSTTAQTFTYPGTSPAISANGTGNGILWAFENSSTAVLYAFEANNLAVELYNSNQAANGRDHFGSGNKYIVPTIADGKVFVGTTNSVAVFGLLSHAAITDGDYKLTNASSGLVLDDPESSKTQGTQIIEWPSTGRPNQSWRFAVQPSGAYTIQNVSSGLYLTDPNGSSVRGTKLEQAAATGDGTQLWALTPSGSGFVIVNQAANLVIDDPDGSKKEGTGIILWPPDKGLNQTWIIQ